MGNIANQPRTVFIQTPMPLGHASSVVDEVAVFILSLDLSRSQVGLTSLNPLVFPALDIDDRASMDCLPVSSTKVKVLLQGYAATTGAALVPGPTPSTDGRDISAKLFGRTQVPGPIRT